MTKEAELFIEYIDQFDKTKLPTSNLSNRKKENSKSSVEITCHYFQNLTLNLVKKLEKKYNEDFLLYEYKPDEYYKCAK